jgi:hypothetical protein
MMGSCVRWKVEHDDKIIERHTATLLAISTAAFAMDYTRIPESVASPNVR